MRTASSLTVNSSEMVSTAAVPMQTVPFQAAIVSRWSDYSMLTKPRISLLVLLTVSAGYSLAVPGEWQFIPLFHALVGIALVAAGSSALNQYIERHTDALMQRTANRPLPSGRMHPLEVVSFGIGAGVCGTLYLAVFVNELTAALAAGTYVLYTAAYTPLKRHTSLSTAVGAIPGALPPVLGWTAAGGRLDLSAFWLFAILFLWQFPHFLAIAWIYRNEYARAGLKMLPLGGNLPRVVGILAIGYSLALLPVSLHPRLCGLAGGTYSCVALIGGLVYLLASIRFAWDESTRTARGLLAVSLVYLPTVLIVLVWDHWRLLSY